MRSIPVALLAAAVAFAALPARAEQIVEPSSELKFEKNPTIDGKRYTCLGAGIRKKFVVKVYAIVYCIDEAAAPAEVAKYFEGPGKAHAGLKGEKLAEALEDDANFYKFLMAMPVDKAAQMVFLRSVEATKLKETFTDSLTKSLGGGEKERIASFVNLMTDDVKDGDRMSLRTKANGEIAVGVGGDLKHVKDDKLARAVWDSYLGPSGVSPSLKESVAAGFAALRK